MSRRNRERELPVYSFKAPPILIEKLDIIWRKQGMTSRGEAIRQAIREYIEKHKDLLSDQP